MAGYKIAYSEPAREDLDRLPPKHAAQVVRKIGRLELGWHGDIKRLQQHDVAFRLRMGDFRILFDVVNDVIIIRRIKDRKAAYD